MLVIYIMNALLKSISLIFIVLLSPQSIAQEPNWQPYAKFLSQYVIPTPYQKGMLNWVQYSQIKNDASFQNIVETIENYPIKNLHSKSEKLAFYINAYNIFAIKMIVDHWPVDSIKDIGSLFQPVWKRPAGSINGESVSLEYLEHKIIRTLGEPRVHFAINCASISCPNLRTEPYTSLKLSQQLQEQTLHFLNDPYKGLKVGNARIRVSKIFKWFEKDFEKWGGIEAFIAQYRPEFKNTKIRANIRYNWSVNGD